MRVEVFSTDFDVSPVTRAYAESRVWLAVRRITRRVSWVGVRLIGRPGKAGATRVVCQIDVWLRGAGLVTVRHTDTNAYVGIECAGVRLKQAIARKLRRADAP